MRVKILFCTVVIVMSSLCLSCISARVNREGASAFLGKKIDTARKYFKYDGEYYGPNQRGDLIYGFNNIVHTYKVSKTTTKKFKSSSSRQIYKLEFYEYTDGCLVYPGNIHYELRQRSSGFEISGSTGQQSINSPSSSTYTVHRNDNSSIHNELNYFNNEIRRLEAVSVKDQDWKFSSTPIGSWYYTYYVHSGSPRVYSIYRCDVYEDSKSETENAIACRYLGRYDSYYDAKYNKISIEQLEQILNNYKQKGFSLNIFKEGIDISCVVRGDIIVAVIDTFDSDATDYEDMWDGKYENLLHIGE